ncbi:hypothetical protein MHYP_G00032600 [Metynnis hypsauchen]
MTALRSTKARQPQNVHRTPPDGADSIIVSSRLWWAAAPVQSGAGSAYGFVFLCDVASSASPETLGTYVWLSCIIGAKRGMKKMKR